MFEGLYLARVNEDGSYGTPIKLEGMTEITPITTSDESEEEYIHLSHVCEGTITCDMDYKKWKDFVWTAILNLKRSERHLVSKNIWGR